jgi:arsenite oxidase small subunit
LFFAFWCVTLLFNLNVCGGSWQGWMNGLIVVNSLPGKGFTGMAKDLVKERVSRRNFLKLGGGVALGTVLVQQAAAQDAPPPGSTTLPYPTQVIGKVAEMAENEAVSFTYPDVNSPCVAIRMGKPTAGGIGPNGDVVAYSILCTHMGCPVSYDPASRNFKCPCHFSVFDSEKEGQMVVGQATEDLPQLILSYDEASDELSAIGVERLIYGRQSNIL